MVSSHGEGRLDGSHVRIGLFASKDLPSEDSEAVDVCRSGVALVTYDLWSHPAVCPGLSRVVPATGEDITRQTEVGDAAVSQRVQQHIGGLQVPVKQTFGHGTGRGSRTDQQMQSDNAIVG